MSDISDSIRSAADRWMQAWVTRDMEVLEDSLASDFILVMSAKPGDRLDRAAWLAMACTRYTASDFRYRDVQVRPIGDDAAVMSSVAEFHAEVDGVPRNGPLFIVDIWQRSGDGRWQVRARYSSVPETLSGSADAVQKLAPS
jgi:uncharacterized protein (TIGR02246 family)